MWCCLRFQACALIFKIVLKMVLSKHHFESSILVTAKMHFSKRRHSVTRRCLVPRDRLVFSEFVETVEKLFGFGDGIKVCPASFHYFDSKGERVLFSTDEELAIAFYLTEKELKIDIEELQPSDSSISLLKVENPSMNSSLYYSTPPSVQESSPYSSDNRNNSRRHTNFGTLARCTPALYKSKIVPKIHSRWPIENSSLLMSKTFTKREPNFTGKDVKRRRIKSGGYNYNYHKYKANLSCGDCHCHDVVEDSNSSALMSDEEVVKKCEDFVVVSQKRGFLGNVGQLLTKVCAFLFPMVVRGV